MYTTYIFSNALQQISNAYMVLCVMFHMGQNSKQINIAKYVSKFLIYGRKMLDKCVESKKKKYVHCPFLQSQAK